MATLLIFFQLFIAKVTQANGLPDKGQTSKTAPVSQNMYISYLIIYQ
jgi:hypothetical protein